MMRVAMWVVAAAICFSASASEGGPKAIVSTIARVEVLPTSLEVVLVLKQKGTDAKAALEALKAARDAALAKLVLIGFKVDAARVDNPSITDKGAASAIQMAMAARSGNRLKRKDKKDEEGQTEVQMQQILRVPFALTGKDILSIVAESEGLKTAVRGAKLLPETAAEETDDEAEAALAMQRMYQGGKPKAGALSFEFVALRTPETEQRAFAEALKKAKDKATNIAIAAGLKSAEFNSITSQETDGVADDENPYYRPSTHPKDVISGDSAALTLTVTLLVECLLK